MDLSQLRKEIDEIDEALLPLLIKRLDTAQQIAQVKIENNLPVRNEQREQEILAHLQVAGGAYAARLQRVYERILEESRALQEEIRLKTE